MPRVARVGCTGAWANGRMAAICAGVTGRDTDAIWRDCCIAACGTKVEARSFTKVWRVVTLVMLVTFVTLVTLTLRM
jgi:hypothetical protein